MSENVTVGRVYVGEAPPPSLRMMRESVVVYMVPSTGEVRLQPSSSHDMAVTADQSRQIAELMARAHAAAPSIVAAYQTRERARETANATYQRIVRRAIEVAR
ncbi:hypothetical protein I5G97_gp050 [Mycobacterium phage Curiosium]|uniref:Uncharacterized protein n=1 Tax=Mycobacterium phage Curiosium TaxID=2599859 RepID=A0A5J6TVM2_9CAUD|nr:hypothetical protein I5G97_gp050 [Mycobacterium phage Curiosium]QFG14104.1 hypothetical protein PBI_CURIOSIUM_60 [Mycobacterium phage Curiosium]